MAALQNDDFFNGILDAYESFKHESLEDAIASSTKASWGGSGYSVELNPDGYRLIWNNDIGNRYDSPGVIIGVPTCSEEDLSIAFYDNAIERFEEKFQQWKSDYLERLISNA